MYNKVMACGMFHPCSIPVTWLHFKHQSLCVDVFSSVWMVSLGSNRVTAQKKTLSLLQTLSASWLHNFATHFYIYAREKKIAVIQKPLQNNQIPRVNRPDWKKNGFNQKIEENKKKDEESYLSSVPEALQWYQRSVWRFQEERNMRKPPRGRVEPSLQMWSTL